MADRVRSLGGGVLVGVVLGAALTAAAFLLVEERPADTPDLVGRRPAAPAQAADAEPVLDLTTAPGMVDLAPTEEELRWLRGSLERERVRREQARLSSKDTGLDILRRALQHQADLTPLMRDFATFSSHVQVAQGPVHRVEADGGEQPTKVQLGDLPAGTEVIEFGPGVFKLRWKRDWKQQIESVLIRGAGMDETTLEVGDLITVGGDLSHFRMQDVTLVGQALDVRGRAAAIFERVRFARWGTAGYNAPIGSSGEVYVGCRDCEFLGGGNHQALAVRGETIALFEGCLFWRLSQCVSTPGGAGRDSRVGFLNCRFEHSRLVYGAPKYGLYVAGGTVQFGTDDQEDTERRKRWGVEHATEVRGTTFEPAVPLTTLGDLARILDELDVDAPEPLLGIKLVDARRDGWRAFRVAGLDRARRHARFWRVVLSGGQTTVEKGGGSFSIEAGEYLGGVVALPELVRRSGAAAGTALTELKYQRLPWERERAAVQLGLGWPGYWVDARTGEHQLPPAR